MENEWFNDCNSSENIQHKYGRRSIGASGVNVRSETDLYSTDPIAVHELFKVLPFKFNKDVWECAVGDGMMADVLRAYGHNVRCSDIYNYANINGFENIDFTQYEGTWNGDIITNPPYKHAAEFAHKALSVIQQGNYVAFFVKIQFLESKNRRLLFDQYPLKYVYVSTSRVNCYKDADKANDYGGTLFTQAWFIWQKGYIGDTILKHFN